MNGTLEAPLFSLRFFLSRQSFDHYVLSWDVRKDPSYTFAPTIEMLSLAKAKISRILFGG